MPIITAEQIFWQISSVIIAGCYILVSFSSDDSTTGMSIGVIFSSSVVCFSGSVVLLSVSFAKKSKNLTVRKVTKIYRVTKIL